MKLEKRLINSEMLKDILAEQECAQFMLFNLFPKSKLRVVHIDNSNELTIYAIDKEGKKLLIGLRYSPFYGTEKGAEYAEHFITFDIKEPIKYTDFEEADKYILFFGEDIMAENIKMYSFKRTILHAKDERPLFLIHVNADYKEEDMYDFIHDIKCLDTADMKSEALRRKAEELLK